MDDSFGAGKTAPDGSAAGMSDRLVELERLHVRRILEACDWKVKGAGNAADGHPALRHPALRPAPGGVQLQGAAAFADGVEEAGGGLC